MKPAVAALIALALLSPALGKELIAEDIKITLDTTGNAAVLEEYRFVLESTDYPEFDSRIGSQVPEDWRSFSSGIGPHVLGDRREVAVSAVRDWQRSPNYGVVKIAYKVPGFVKKISETGRLATYGVSAEQFAFYATEGKTLYLPPKVTVYIQLDKGFEEILRKNGIEVEPAPYTSYTDSEGRGIYLWRGPLTSAVLGLRYSAELGITESLGFERLYQGIYEFFSTNPVYAIAVLIVLVLAVIYRKQILGLVSESFVGEESVETMKK